MKLNLKLVKSVFVFLLIILSSGDSTIAIDDIFLIAFFFITLFFAFITGTLNKIFKEALFIAGAALGILIYYYLVNGDSDFYTWTGFILKIFIGFFIAAINGISFIKNLIKVTYIISVVSLIGYALQLLMPDTLFNLNNLFGISAKENSNSLIFNFTYLHAQRNCGCMWEPGAFAALLIIVLWLSLVGGFAISKKMQWVFTLAILTTFSTFGYLAFALILFYKYLWRGSFSRKVKYTVILIPLFFYAFINSEILGNKIFEQFANTDDELYTAVNNPDYQVSVTRFTSFAVDYPKLIERPFLGYGVDINTTSEKIMYKDYGSNVVRSSGILVILLEVGIVGLLLYFFIIYQSFKKISNSFYAWGSVLIFFLLLFSNPLQFSSLLFSLFFMRKGVSEESFTSNAMYKKLSFA